MVTINMASFFLVPAQHPRTKVCRNIARNIVPDDGALYLFSTGPKDEPRGVELSNGSVGFVKDPLYDVPRGRVLVGIVGLDRESVLAQAAAKLAGRDLARDSIQALEQAEVDDLMIEVMPEPVEVAAPFVEEAPVVVDSCAKEVQALLDKMLEFTGGPEVLQRFRELGEPGIAELGTFLGRARYGTPAAIVLDKLGVKDD